uniref:Fibrinogen-related protein J1 n=1 Tax=Biomphalaria glabrata TaxID=6526 RepID=A0A1S6XX62_BIOGL|nr:fibrinogen-related protein J1 precursor [Biomphalaria glabrata]
MTLLLHFALYLLFFSFSTAELVIDVQPNVITPEVTQHIVVNCSVTRNQVPTLDVIKSLTLSRYNEKLKEFEALLALEAKTLNLKQLVQFPRSQISFGNLYVTLSLQSPTQSDARVYRCKVEGDNANGTSMSLVAKQEVEYRTNTTALIEEILRLKNEEKNDKCPFMKDELHQRLRLHFVGSSEIIKELIEPLTLTCSLQGFQYDENQNVTVQFMYILHETNGVVATINKGQPVVTTIQENNSKNVKGELSENELKASYIQVTWRNLKSSESGKYFCGAHIIDSKGKSKKLNEMLIVTVATATFDDLVKVIQKLMKQADEDKEKIQENKQKIKNIQEDFDTRQQNLSPFKDILVNGEKDYKEMNTSDSILPDRPCNVNSTKRRLVLNLASGLKVMCDTMTDGGGWIIIQRRIKGMVDFNRDWQEYRDGFGDYNIGEFYLGNENIYKLTSSGNYELRVDLEINYSFYYALYSKFQIMNESNKYKLKISGYLGNATDSLSWHDNLNFSTYKDNKNNIPNCLFKYPGPGGWWFGAGHGSNLNGVWRSDRFNQGINWYGLTGYKKSAYFSEMKALCALFISC